MTTSTPQQFIQEAYILVTGQVATKAELTSFQAMVSGTDYSRLDAAIDSYMNSLTPGVNGLTPGASSVQKLV